MTEINNEYMSLTVDGKSIATARFSKDAAADGTSAWIVSTRPARCSAATKGHHGVDARRAPRHRIRRRRPVREDLARGTISVTG